DPCPAGTLLSHPGYPFVRRRVGLEDSAREEDPRPGDPRPSVRGPFAAVHPPSASCSSPCSCCPRDLLPRTPLPLRRPNPGPANVAYSHIRYRQSICHSWQLRLRYLECWKCRSPIPRLGRPDADLWMVSSAWG